MCCNLNKSKARDQPTLQTRCHWFNLLAAKNWFTLVCGGLSRSSPPEPSLYTCSNLCSYYIIYFFTASPYDCCLSLRAVEKRSTKWLWYIQKLHIHWMDILPLQRVGLSQIGYLRLKKSTGTAALGWMATRICFRMYSRKQLCSWD